MIRHRLVVAGVLLCGILGFRVSGQAVRFAAGRSHVVGSAADHPAVHDLRSLTIAPSSVSGFRMMGRGGWLLTLDTLYRVRIGDHNVQAVAVATGANAYAAPLAASWTPEAVYVAVERGGGHILIQRSRDQGRTWTPLATIRSSYPPLQLRMIQRGGWLETSPGAAGAAMPAQLWRARDGGRRWILAAQGPVGEVMPRRPHVLPNGGQFYWESGTTGWLVPFPIPFANERFLYRTVTGGSTWTPVALTWPPGRTAPQVGNIGTIVDGPQGRVLILVHWQGGTLGWQAGIIVNGRTTGWSPLMPDFPNPVLARNDAEGMLWVAAGRSLWAVTSWRGAVPRATVVTRHLPWNTGLVALQMSRQRGWALTVTVHDHPVLWTTADGGAVWRQVPGEAAIASTS